MRNHITRKGERSAVLGSNEVHNALAAGRDVVLATYLDGRCQAAVVQAVTRTGLGERGHTARQRRGTRAQHERGQIIERFTR